MASVSEAEEREVALGYSAWLARPAIRALGGWMAFQLFNHPLLLGWRRLPLKPGDHLLDLGCGAGTVLSFLDAKLGGSARPTGVDLSLAQLALAARLAGGRRRVQLLQAAASRLPFADSSFDVVISSHVLHNLDQPVLAAALAEVCRLLRPGGSFCFWSFGAERPWQNRLGRGLLHAIMRPPAVIRRHTHFRSAEELRAALRAAGFIDIEPGPLRGFLWPPLVPRLCLLARRPPAAASEAA